MSPGITVRGRWVRLVGLLYGWRELEGHEQNFLALAFGWKVLLLVRVLFHVTTSSSEFAEKELLGQACADAFSRLDSKISKYQPGTTIGRRIIQVREGG